MDIDTTAPVQARYQLTIDASIETTWRLVSDIDAWPAWNFDVTAATLDGDLAPGSTFRWKARGMSIVSKLAEVAPPHRISWTGRSFGARAIHVCLLEQGDHGVVVRTEESMSGWVVRLFSGSLRRILDRSLRKWGEHLKAAAEHR